MEWLILNTILNRFPGDFKPVPVSQSIKFLKTNKSLSLTDVTDFHR